MNRKNDNYDYMADTWDAMTDGMYGDMPDGFNGLLRFTTYIDKDENKMLNN